MGKVKFEISNDKFIRKPSASHQLSILIGMDSFTYMVSDTNQEILAVKDFSYNSSIQNGRDLEKNIEELFQQDNFLKSSHQNIRLGFINSKSALVPSRLYNEVEQRTYLSHLTDIDDKSSILVDHLESFSAYDHIDWFEPNRNWLVKWIWMTKKMTMMRRRIR